MLEARKLYFSYVEGDQLDERSEIFRDISLSLHAGQFVALLGRNGSGKSTLGKLFNGLLLPTSGEVVVDGLKSDAADNAWEIKRLVGLVFQDPSRQIVNAVVEGDIAFGLENLGLEPEEIRNRIDDVLRDLNIEDLRLSEPHYLSGGQKQRVALAGVMAMRPRYLILDEPTSMLDPKGRRSVLSTVRRLQSEQNLGVLYITHHVDEAMAADRILVLNEGRFVLDTDDPRRLFNNLDKLAELGLHVPDACELGAWLNLRLDGFAWQIGQGGESLAQHFIEAMGQQFLSQKDVSSTSADICGTHNALCIGIGADKEVDAGIGNLAIGVGAAADGDGAAVDGVGAAVDGVGAAVDGVGAAADGVGAAVDGVGAAAAIFNDRPVIVSLEKVTFTYMEGTPFETVGCREVSLDVYEGECLGIIGSTGSGKSTMLQLFNGLLRCQSGRVTSFGNEISSKTKGNSLAEVRKKIGFLFQFSEQQLFETTVYDDIAFGPRNYGLSEGQVKERVERALEEVGLCRELLHRSPLTLSGGEKRRVALAGILACDPLCLVLDEPTVGLDPQGVREQLELLRHLNKDCGFTVVLISHRYEEVALLADRLAVMANGKLLKVDSVPSILYDEELLRRAQLEGPELCRMFAALHRNGIALDMWPIDLRSARSACQKLLEAVGERANP